MIGLDISDRSIKIVEITDGEKRRLRAACWSPMGAGLIRRGVLHDLAGTQENIKVAMTRCAPVPVAGQNVVVSIPESQSFLRVIELPRLSEAETDEAVQWAIRQHIPFDLDRVYLDWQPIAATAARSGYRQILVGAAQKDVVDPLLRVLDNLQLHVVALELEAQAIVRSLLPQDSQDVTGILIVDLAATSTNIIFFDQGALRFTTSIQQGGDHLTTALAEALQLPLNVAAEKKALVGVMGQGPDAAIATVLEQATLRIVQHISSIVLEFTSQLSSEGGLRAILLSGGSANMPGILSVFATVFPGIPVQLGNPWINLTVSDTGAEQPLAAADATHFTTSIGLALREAEAASA